MGENTMSDGYYAAHEANRWDRRHIPMFYIVEDKVHLLARQVLAISDECYPQDDSKWTTEHNKYFSHLYLNQLTARFHPGFEMKLGMTNLENGELGTHPCILVLICFSLANLYFYNSQLRSFHPRAWSPSVAGSNRLFYSQKSEQSIGTLILSMNPYCKEG